MPDEHQLPPDGRPEHGTHGRDLPDRELLVAYLDGELQADEARQVERLIASDARVESQVRQLERAWELLDRLPRAEVGPSFTESTVEMLTLAAEDELRVAGGKRRGAAWTLVLLAACLAGFAGARLWPDANRQLLRDLPVIDNLEAYRQTPDLDFLRQLAESAAFEGQTVSGALPASLAQRKEWLVSLGAEQKQDVHRKYERFRHLPADEQLRLREMQSAIAADGDAARLAATLALFQQWLEQLPGVERAELMALEGERRLQRVRRLRRDETRRLVPEDVQPFTSWFAGVFPKVLPPPARAKLEQELAGASEDERPVVLRRELARMQQQGLLPQGSKRAQAGGAPRRPGAGPLIKPQALAELAKTLSPHGQQALNNARTGAERRGLVLSWANQAFGAAGRGSQLSLPDVDDDELKRFFEQLSPVQRTHLLNLPAEQMKRQLLARYQAKRAAEKKQKTAE